MVSETVGPDPASESEDLEYFERVPALCEDAAGMYDLLSPLGRDSVPYVVFDAEQVERMVDHPTSCSRRVA